MPRGDANGWFKFHRRAIEGDLGHNPLLLTIWTTLLSWAYWQPSSILWEGSRRDVPAGSVVFGIKEIADKWGISRSVVKKWLHYLHSTGRIVLETCPRGSLAIICNWEHYQHVDHQPRPVSDHVVPAACPQRDTPKEGKKERNIYPDEFLKLWELHPKGSMAEAHGKWSKILASDREDFSKALTNYVAECDAKGTEADFRKDLSTFIRKSRSEPWREFIERHDVRAASKVFTPEELAEAHAKAQSEIDLAIGGAS